jgi:NAD(P)-dependent dehydrogenase (short-subunit alcohol dehydrogenase family)
MADLEDGSLTPLPHKTFIQGDTIEAFRYMAQAKHIGKIAVMQTPAVANIGELLRPHVTYFITGGLSGLGLLVAQWLVDNGARHLALLGRRAPSEEAKEVISELEAAGATIFTTQADVTKQEQVQAALDTIAETLPPVAGVIHSAGALDDGVLTQQNWERFAHVLGAKVDGAWHLHELTLDNDLDFFVLFSSMAAITGAAGQGAHAPANVFLDSLAQYRQAQGLPAVAIDWGAWTETGAAVRHEVFDRIATKGIGTIPPEQGLKVLGKLMTSATPAHIAVSPITNWTQFRQQYAHNPLFADLIEQAAPVVQETEKAAAQTTGLMPKLNAATPNKRQSLMLDFVETQARQVLGLDADYPVDERAALSDMGLDSLMAVELKNRLNSNLELKRPLPATLVFDYPTTAAISQFLLQNVALDNEAELEASAEPEETDETSLLDDLESLSDDDVDKLFAEMGFSEDMYDDE